MGSENKMKQQQVVLAQLGPYQIVFDPQQEITQTKVIGGAISWKELEERVLKGDLSFLEAIQQAPQIFKESEFEQWWNQLLEQQRGRLLLKVYYLQNQQKINEATAQAICNLIGADWTVIKTWTKKELKKYVQDLPQAELIDLAQILWKRYVDWQTSFFHFWTSFQIINRRGIINKGGLSVDFPKKFKRKLEQVFEKIKELNLIPIIIFLQGAHNYGLADEKSDFDFKALCINSEPWKTDLESMTVSYNKTGELLDIKGWNRWQEIFATMNISYLELLWSHGFWINESFEEFFWTLELILEEELFHKAFLVNGSIIGQMSSKLKALDRPYPTKADVLAKYGYDPKQLHHFFRLYWTLKSNLIKGVIQPQDLWLRWTPYERANLMKMKRTKTVVDLNQTKIKMQELLDQKTQEWRATIPDGWTSDRFRKQLISEVKESLTLLEPFWRAGLKNQFQIQMKNRSKNQERGNNADC